MRQSSFSSPEGATQLGAIPHVSFLMLDSVSQKRVAPSHVSPFQGFPTPGNNGNPGRCPGLVYDAPSGRIRQKEPAGRPHRWGDLCSTSPPAARYMSGILPPIPFIKTRGGRMPPIRQKEPAGRPHRWGDLCSTSPPATQQRSGWASQAESRRDEMSCTPPCIE
jgi:hypothetical protein